MFDQINSRADLTAVDQIDEIIRFFFENLALVTYLTISSKLTTLMQQETITATIRKPILSWKSILKFEKSIDDDDGKKMETVIELRWNCNRTEHQINYETIIQMRMTDEVSSISKVVWQAFQLAPI